MEETIAVEWLDGPGKGTYEFLKRVFGGYQRREADGSLTLLVGNQPLREVRPGEILTRHMMS